MSALDQEFVEETNAEKLERVGATALITSSTPFGSADTQAVVYPTQHAIANARLSLLNTVPTDKDGLGYQYDIAPEEV